MDDRIRREESVKNANKSSNSPHDQKIQQWDRNETIASRGNSQFNTTVQKSRRFEVHIPESEDFPAYKAEMPARVPAPANRPSSVPVQPARPAAANSARMPVRPGTAQSGSGTPRANARATVSASAAQTKSGAAPRRASAERPQLAKTKSAPRKQKNNADRAYNFVKGTLVTCLCFIFIATLTVVACSVAFGFINDVLVIDNENKGYSVVVNIPEGATYDDIFDILTENGLVSQPLLTDFFCKFRHYDYEAAYDDETGELLYDEATGEVLQVPVKYQPGVYYVYADSGIENILDSMLVNNSLNKGTVRLTFPEGFTIAEVFEKIEKYEVCEAEKLYANLEIVADQYSFIKKLTDSEGRYLKAEGYLFPDTYDFYIGESASSVLKKLLSNFENKWEKEYDDRLKELGMTMDEVVTLASIIQCEAKDGSQMADISAVIHNRLNDPASYPTLDMDSTSNYINSLKSFNVLSEIHYSLYLESYNTYGKPGLPPGAICNPGASAIRAALYPSDNDYYFFCHAEDGQVYYASTASEHQDNVQRVVYGSIGGN